MVVPVARYMGNYVEVEVEAKPGNTLDYEFSEDGKS